MPVWGIKTNFDDAIATCDVLTHEQMPFTIARALTMTAQDAQKDTRDLTQRVFKLRNDWTTRNIKITPAQKDTLVATVFSDTENRETGAKDYLPSQQEGEERVPIQGRKRIAIPTKYLLSMVGNKPMPDWLRPAAMMKYADLNGKFATTRDRGKVKKGTLRRRPATINNLIFFVPSDSSGREIPLPGGAFVIMARSVGDPKAAYPMYLLVTEASIKARFPMQATVEAAVAAGIGPNFDRAAAEVMGSELLRGTGFRLKF